MKRNDDIPDRYPLSQMMYPVPLATVKLGQLPHPKANTMYRTDNGEAFGLAIEQARRRIEEAFGVDITWGSIGRRKQLITRLNERLLASRTLCVGAKTTHER